MFRPPQFASRRIPPCEPRTPPALNLRCASRISCGHCDSRKTRPETFCFQIIDKRVRNSLNKWTFKSLYFGTMRTLSLHPPCFQYFRKNTPYIYLDFSSPNDPPLAPKRAKSSIIIKFALRRGAKSQARQRTRKVRSHPARGATRTTVALTRRPSNDILNQQKSAAVPSASFRTIPTCDAST